VPNPPVSPETRCHLGRRAALIAGGLGAAAIALPVGARQPRSAPAPAAIVAPLAIEVPGAEQPVRLESLKVETEVAGGVAETRIEMVFLNPNARVLEGKLVFPLGPGQAVTGFALDVEGRLRDAVPVPKARAEQVFEDISRQRIDPGLLKQVAGNRYELRLYPLNPNATRTVVLRLGEAAAARLVLPLAFAASVPRLEVSVRYPAAVAAPVVEADGGLGLAFLADPTGGWTARRRFVGASLPRTPLVVHGPAATGPEITTETRGAEAWFSVLLPVDDRPGRGMEPRPVAQRLQIVWDQSASMAARDRTRELALLDALFRQAGFVDVTLVRVADAVLPPERHAVREGDWASLRRALESTVHDGASRLGAVEHDGVSAEALWFTDGLSTWGAPWRPSFPVPVRAIVSTVVADRAALARLAESSGGRLVDLLQHSDEESRRALLGRGSEVVEVGAVGARDVMLASRHPSEGRIAIAGAFENAGGGPARLVVRLRRADGSLATVRLAVHRERHGGRLAGAAWARLALASLAGGTAAERARSTEIATRFALPSADTSLLVLERAADYVRHGIAVPASEPALLAEVQTLAARAAVGVAASRAERIERVVRRFESRIAWWSRDDWRAAPAVRPFDALQPAGGAVGGREELAARLASPRPALPMPVAPAALAAPAMAEATSGLSSADAANRADLGALRRSLSRGDVSRERQAMPSEAADAPRAAIALRPAPADSAWLRKLDRLAPAERLALYLAMRDANRQSVGFFLEAADWFLARGDRASREIGLRALSNLAELDLQSRQLLRLLAYRLGQAGEHDLAVAVFEQVRELAPFEPQSHRDLGLALASRDAAGDRQRAVASLAEVVTGTWDGRFADVELIALTELNAIAAASARDGRPLDTSALDKRLLRNLPLDLRVVLAWDADDTDVDLHVVDPEGDTVFYGRPLSRQGGAITRDATGGYGPEEFALRVAKPGRYRVEAHFFGHRQQVLTSARGSCSGSRAASARRRRRTVGPRSGSPAAAASVSWSARSR
jgi:hypothetical protein